MISTQLIKKRHKDIDPYKPSIYKTYGYSDISGILSDSYDEISHQEFHKVKESKSEDLPLAQSIMTNYLLRLLTLQKTHPKISTDLIKAIIDELKSEPLKSVQTYNGKLEFPLTEMYFPHQYGQKLLAIIMNKKLNFTPLQADLYFLCMLSQFYRAFDVKNALTKKQIISWFETEILHTMNSTSFSAESKLIQFQVLFELIKCYANNHENPWLDKRLGKTYTTTCQRLMRQTRTAARQMLSEDKEACVTGSAVAAMVPQLSLFTQHINNYTLTLFPNKKPNTLERLQDEILHSVLEPRQQTIG